MNYIAINNRIYHVKTEDFRRLPMTSDFKFIYEKYQPIHNPPKPIPLKVDFVYCEYSSFKQK
jgi:hypothetical protein